MEIQKDIDQLQNILYRAKRNWGRANQHAIEYLEHWESLSKQTLKELISFDPPSEPRESLTGAILGKKFHISVNPILKTGAIYAELTISLPPSEHHNRTELGRLLIDKDGRIYNTNTETVLTEHDDMPSYLLLLNILMATLETTAQ